MKSDPYVALPNLEHDWAEAWASGNEGLCAHLMGDDFVEISAAGRLLSRAEWLDEMEARGPQAIEWHDIRVRPLGRVAVVHCRLTVLASRSRKGRNGTYLLTDVWVYRGDQWVAVSRQVTGPVERERHAAPALQLVASHP